MNDRRVRTGSERVGIRQREAGKILQAGVGAGGAARNSALWERKFRGREEDPLRPGTGQRVGAVMATLSSLGVRLEARKVFGQGGDTAESIVTGQSQRKG